MGQLEFIEGEEVTAKLILDTFRIASSKKISRVLRQPGKYILIYDDSAFRGANRNFEVIPDRLVIEDHKKLIYTDFIEFKLEYFSSLINRIETVFPNIYEFIIGENIESVKVKPACAITNTTNSIERIKIAMHGVTEIQDLLLDPKNAIALDIFVLAELIRMFYIGEKDYTKGFLIYKQVLKYVKALLEEGVNAEYIINKITDNPEIVDNNNFFKGTNERLYFTVFKNQILRTPKQTAYIDSLDLKYLSALGVISEVLNDKRFGRRE